LPGPLSPAYSESSRSVMPAPHHIPPDLQTLSIYLLVMKLAFVCIRALTLQWLVSDDPEILNNWIMQQIRGLLLAFASDLRKSSG
jgi:hypothetical protein